MLRPNASSPLAVSASLLASLLLALAACTEDPSAPYERATLTTTLQSEVRTATTILTFVSDPTWGAQDVCLNSSVPSTCPAGATLYGTLGSGWAADLSIIPGASWIWGAGITGTTSPAFPAEFLFSKSFVLPQSPIEGSISIAVDDFAEVIVNGASVGTTGSVTDGSLAGAAQSSLKTFDIGPFLITGTNVITVRAANGPFGCGAGAYSCNPAGVVFGGSLKSGGAADLIRDLTDAVRSLNLTPLGIENSLTAKLQHALTAFDAGSIVATCGSLNAFIHEVQAQSGKAINATDADELLVSAERVRAVLGCL
jgi:hypothetical protein